MFAWASQLFLCNHVWTLRHTPQILSQLPVAHSVPHYCWIAAVERKILCYVPCTNSNVCRMPLGCSRQLSLWHVTVVTNEAINQLLCFETFLVPGGVINFAHTTRNSANCLSSAIIYGWFHDYHFFLSLLAVWLSRQGWMPTCLTSASSTSCIWSVGDSSTSMTGCRSDGLAG